MNLEKEMPPSADGSIAPAVDRAFVRNLAVKNFEALQAAAIAGKNTHQLALDQSDEIETLIKTLQPDDRPKFSALYEQELNAATQASVEKTMAMTSQTANQLLDNVTKTNNVYRWISLIAFFIVLIGFIKMMKS
ncbi:hypothetical protein VM94_03011 [Janthinobacterium sp. KBS0711]|uniref:hypothetical protein n=1 Tax=Janthinobacterium sp. KBS0711 TaxID=1649647 RepID=UPI00063720D6|nr:hypothetical protein [Janthinobacterium sp. KBS0711]KKO63261.1 hypothetical protein VM94_03011 [Janthinobacterium sp. KBS0711]TSD72758.1 hypothetical protein FFI39_018230 [Janthinobacterium sp. KBS0711]